ncbi:hypothetical protein IBE71_10040, partial [Francisella tularensis]|nr:hypothetical protein [Francisella tularensis]
ITDLYAYAKPTNGCKTAPLSGIKRFTAAIPVAIYNGLICIRKANKWL